LLICDLGPQKVKCTTALVNASKSGLNKWDESFVFRYENEPLIGIRVTDSTLGIRNEVIGSTTVNLWNVISAHEIAHDHDYIYKLGKKVGKISLSFDWYNRACGILPKFVRLSIRQAFG